MKSSIILLSLVFSSLSFAQGFTPHHMDLEMTSAEYQTLLANESKKSMLPKLADDERITAAIKMGTRLSKWIATINTGRTPTTAMRLTSALTRRGVPIDKPNIYNPTIIGRDMAKVMSELPVEMKTVISGASELPGTTSVDDETFIKHSRLLDKIYQSAARFKSVDVYRVHYISGAALDLRGYYFLNKNNFTSESLRDIALIPEAQKAPLKEALVKVCRNSSNFGNCDKTVSTAFTENKLADFYNKFYPASKKLWNQFFNIPASGVRRDVNWTGNTMTVPFNKPTIPKFIPYLQDNVEEEFRFKEWKLKLNFGTFSNGPRLIFEAGVVPHVNGLGGNEITMDSNQPIEEYESQWTIRHEFGHVIGLPDCYHEFFDSGLGAYVNYQLDITDLMCSRAGNMTERIYQELKKSYQR